MKLRRSIFNLHLAVGLLVGLIASIVGVTGSLIVFRREIDEAVYAHLMRVEPRESQVSIQSVMDAVRQARPDYRILQMRLPRTSENTFAVLVRRPDGRAVQIYVDPYSGKLLGEHDYASSMTWLLFRLHENFLIGDRVGGVGLRINGIGAVLVLLMCLTGLILWWPGRGKGGGRGWRQSLVVKWRASWKRINYDLHRAIGAAALVFIVIVALTGLTLAFPDLTRRTIHFLTRSQPAPASPAARAISVADLASSARPPSLDELNRRAIEALPGWKTLSFALPATPQDPLRVSLVPATPQAVKTGEVSRIHFDQYTGRILQIDDGAHASLGARLVNLLRPVHFGTVGGMWTRWLWFVLGFVPLALFTTGLLMYWNRVVVKRIRRGRAMAPGALVSMEGETFEPRRMTTLTRIARRELTEMARDGRFRSTSVIILVLLLVSLLVGWKGYAEHLALQTEAQSRQREQWLNMIRMPPHLVAHSGAVIYKLRMPLSALDQGIESYVGASVFLEAHKRNLFDHKPAEESPTAQRLGEVTVGVTLQLLVPLLIILLTYASFAGEREQGTLRQIISLGVRKRDLALGKALGTAAPLLLLLVPVTVLGVLAIALLDRTGMLLESTLRLALMIGFYLAYFVIFLCVGLVVSAKSANARRALLLLLGFWFISCLLIPRVAVELGQRIYPSPTTREFTEELEKGKKAHPGFSARRERVVERLKQEYGITNAAELPISPYGLTLYEAEEDEIKTYERHFNRLFESYERQNRLYQAAAAMTPLIAVQTLSMGLAGSDWNYHRHFADAAEQYRRVLVQTMNRGITDKGAADQYTESGHELYEQVPPFSYIAPGPAWILDRMKLSLLFLSLWCAVVAVATPLALLKLRVD